MVMYGDSGPHTGLISQCKPHQDPGSVSGAEVVRIKVRDLEIVDTKLSWILNTCDRCARCLRWPSLRSDGLVLNKCQAWVWLLRV